MWISRHEGTTRHKNYMLWYNMGEGWGDRRPYPIKGSSPSHQGLFALIKKHFSTPSWVISRGYWKYFFFHYFICLLAKNVPIKIQNSIIVFFNDIKFICIKDIISRRYVRVQYRIAFYCHTRLHLGCSAKLRIWQVSACKMEPQSGTIITDWASQPAVYLLWFSQCCAVSPPQLFPPSKKYVRCPPHPNICFPPQVVPPI